MTIEDRIEHLTKTLGEIQKIATDASQVSIIGWGILSAAASAKAELAREILKVLERNRIEFLQEVAKDFGVPVV